MTFGFFQHWHFFRKNFDILLLFFMTLFNILYYDFYVKSNYSIYHTLPFFMTVVFFWHIILQLIFIKFFDILWPLFMHEITLHILCPFYDFWWFLTMTFFHYIFQHSILWLFATYYTMKCVALNYHIYHTIHFFMTCNFLYWHFLMKNIYAYWWFFSRYTIFFYTFFHEITLYIILSLFLFYFWWLFNRPLLTFFMKIFNMTFFRKLLLIAFFHIYHDIFQPFWTYHRTYYITTYST